MNKKEVMALLKQTVNATIAECNGFSTDSFYKTKNSKWSAAQNFAHLTLSAKILNRALKAPKIGLWYKFGRKFFSESRDYKTIVEIYDKANAIPRTQVTGFEPRMKPESTMNYELNSFKEMHDSLIESLESWTESQINSYLLPHPLIGKITVKEMLFFTDYHIKHHQKAIKTALQSEG